MGGPLGWAFFLLRVGFLSYALYASTQRSALRSVDNSMCPEVLITFSCLLASLTRLHQASTLRKMMISALQRWRTMLCRRIHSMPSHHNARARRRCSWGGHRLRPENSTLS
jgi:hypothetical protein